MENLKELVKTGKATVVDVRTFQEFSGGHVAGSVNIPLQEIAQRLDDFRSMKNVVVCCASGNRSGQAARFLQQHGIAVQNGGSWLTINAFLNN
jgi:rhodanese-related sulfurtransferase